MQRTGELNGAALRLLPLRAPLPKEGGEARFPARLKLFAWGRNDTAKGPVILDATTAEVFSANQRTIGRERVAVDFEHNTVPGMPEYERSHEPRPVAAHGAPKLVPGDGLYLEGIAPTPDGLKALSNYEDLSPAPWLAADGTLLALHSVALCHAGSVYDLTLAGAALAAMTASLLPRNADTPVRTSPNPTNPMPEKTLTLAALAALIGLTADASEEQVSAKLKALAAPAAPPNLASLEARLTALTSEVAELRKGAEGAERNALLAEAARDGKVIPLSNEQIALTPLSALREMVGKLEAKVVPMSAGGRPLPRQAGAPDKREQISVLLATIKARDNCSHEDAYRRAQTEKPELFK